jgi:hypothetical protein
MFISAEHCCCFLGLSDGAVSAEQILQHRIWDERIFMHVREPFAKFVDSPNYSESELCGGAVTVSFSKYLPMHFLQSSTHFSKTLQTVCRKLQEDSGTGGFGLGALFSWLEKLINLMGRDLDCMADVLIGIHRSRWAHSCHFSFAQRWRSTNISPPS